MSSMPVGATSAARAKPVADRSAARPERSDLQIATASGHIRRANGGPGQTRTADLTLIRRAL